MGRGISCFLSFLCVFHPFFVFFTASAPENPVVVVVGVNGVYQKLGKEIQREHGGAQVSQQREYAFLFQVL
jgi:hypothetical protein